MIKEQLLRYQEEFKEALQDLKTKGKRKRQIPNILTSLRLLAPFFILPSAFVGNVPLVLTFVGVFSITDFLDGAIARTFHLTSNLGRDLDAFCDKIFAGTLLLGASFMNPILLINLGLELAITSINVRAKLKGLDPKSLYIGKIKTFFLFPLLGLSLVSNALAIEPIFYTLLGITASLQGITAYSYQGKYQKDLAAKRREAMPVLTPSPKREEQDREEEKEMIHILSLREQKMETLKEMRSILTEEIGLEKPIEPTFSKEKQYHIEKKD